MFLKNKKINFNPAVSENLKLLIYKNIKNDLFIIFLVRKHPFSIEKFHNLGFENSDHKIL